MFLFSSSDNTDPNTNGRNYWAVKAGRTEGICRVGPDRVPAPRSCKPGADARCRAGRT